MGNNYNQNRSTTESFHISNNYLTGFIVLSFFTLLMYIFVITLILWNKKLRRRPSNKFFVNLLISDGIVSISFISFTRHSIKKWDEESFFENYFTLQTLANVAVVLSMLNLTLITADRLIAVKWPFFYEDRIPTNQSLIAITIVWGITIVHAMIIITLFNVLHPHTSRYLGNVIFVVIVITGFITLLISNSFVFVEARRQLRTTEKINCSIVDLSGEPSCKSSNKERISEKKNLDW